jgi:alkanesulfonate monooxygenase SsuD/methylene tetrahydromethanopterin reductase-like flavin-dependent oxidoreductase (luciferase family)
MDFSLFSYFGRWPGKSEAESFDANFELIDAAEAMGWDTAWIAGAHLTGNATIDSQPLVLAAAVAARTRRIKIGSGVHLPGLKVPGEKFMTEAVLKRGANSIGITGRSPGNFKYAFEHLPPADPIEAAEQVATLDQISRGRFIYGVGGYTYGEERRRAHFMEYLDVMKKVWTEDVFSGFQGEFYNYPAIPQGTDITPRPYQKPHPPILLPLDSQQSFEPMGARGYQIAIGGGTAHNLRGSSVLAQDVKKYRQAWRDAGNPGNPWLALRIPTHVCDTKEELARDVEAIMKKMKETAERAARTNLSLTTPGTPSVAATEQVNLYGTPDEVVEKIHALREQFGADEIMFEAKSGDTHPPERVLNTMRLITDKVIPKFK